MEPQTPAPLEPAIKVETPTDQQEENVSSLILLCICSHVFNNQINFDKVDDQQVVEETVPMETETRGEKRKREDDDEDVGSTEKKRREDSPVKSPDKPIDQSPSKPVATPASVVVPVKIPIKEDEPEIDYEKPQLSWCK